jgi:AcrR family transcriptional regulator
MANTRSRSARVVSSGTPSGQVSEIQRLRILAAMVEVAAERGCATVTVAHIVTRAGVSRRTFYELFASREECFLAAFDDAVARASAVVRTACAGRRAWRERVRAGLLALLVFFDEDPALARVCIVEALAGGPSVLERRGEVMAKLVAAVDEGRAEKARKGTGPPLPLAADGVVGAVLSLIHVRLLAQEPEPEPLAGLLGALMSVIVLPYLGQSAARRELERPAPMLPLLGRSPRTSAPLEDLGMRITYRTVSVLRAIAAHPECSNREVATLAGIQDEGQTSKLLTRLCNLGLIDNRDANAAKTAPNAWRLTAKGEQVEQAIRVRNGAASSPP